MSCILIVEPDRGVRDLLTQILEGHGHSVYRESNGKDALDFMETAAGRNFVNLVTTGCEMPVVNGTEFCRLIRASYPDIPIIMIGMVRPEPLAADDFLQKPFSVDDLITKVDALLAK